MNKTEKYFFLYLKTGGGHLAPARAISRYLNKQYSSEVDTVLIDGFEEAPWYASFIVEDGYRLLQNYAKWIYELLYASNKIISFAKWNANLVCGRTIPYLTRRILEEKPTKIVICHFFLIKPVFDILKKHNLNIPVFTVVTDPYTAHPLWFINKKQNLIVFSERLKQYAIGKKIPARNINVFPFILDQKLSAPLSVAEVDSIKLKYGFKSEDKIILIVGGGDGIPKGRRILKNITANVSGAHIVIVCGKNNGLYNYAIRLQKRCGKSQLTVYGYIDFMQELLNMSDIVVTKCGASTFMEILMTKKIPVVNSYMWEQEKGNVEFLIDNGLGIYEKNVSRLPAVINRLLNDDDYYASLITNIQNAKLSNGTEQVGEFIKNFN